MPFVLNSSKLPRMEPYQQQPNSHSQIRDNFASTHWSLVLAAGVRAGAESEQALAALCQRYWLPLYVYARRRVAHVHEAQDLTQAFFLRLLDQNVLAAATPERGRFRSFLLTSMKNFLTNEWNRDQAAKRGGGRQRLSLDWESGESRISAEPAHYSTPEREFERQWALTLLDNVVQRLKREFDLAGKSHQFEVLKETLTGGRAALDYDTVAAELGMSEAASRQAASRLRKRYREMLRDEVAATVENESEIDDEINRLFHALGG